MIKTPLNVEGSFNISEFKDKTSFYLLSRAQKYALIVSAEYNGVEFIERVP